MRRMVWVGLLGLALVACGGDDAPSGDGSSDVGVGADGGSADSSATDSSATDSSATDSSATDSSAAGQDGAQTGTGIPSYDIIHFETGPGRAISSGPFPDDTLLDGGRVSLAPLEEDPRLKDLVKTELLPAWGAYAAERSGFGTTMPAWFFVDAEPDQASFAGKLRIVALAGLDAGRDVAAQFIWSSSAQAFGVFPAWGDYLAPETTYAVLVETGPTVTGKPIVSPANFQALLTGDEPSWAGLRQWIADAGKSPTDYLVGTVFTTEGPLEYGKGLIAAVDAWTLKPASLAYRWDPDASQMVDAAPVMGADLETYFGVPEAPFENNPGTWGGNRTHAETLLGYNQHYSGGTRHVDFGAVLNGSIRVPVFNATIEGGAIVPRGFEWVDGQPKVQTEAIAPLTIVLCKDQVADPKNLPVAIFNHGGGALRSDLMAFANANCQVGVATVAIDMFSHGGRRKTVWADSVGAIVPAVADDENEYSGKVAGDAGFVPDYVGDGGASAASVAPFFAIASDADPMIVEANLLTVTSDTYTVLRMVKEGDFSALIDGLSFDSTRIFHESLSFGTSFSAPLQALTDDFRGIVSSVGSGYMLSVNMPMAPNNAVSAAGILFLALGLPTPIPDLTSAAPTDFALGFHQWLHERGDPMLWAPYVLRFRQGPRPPVVSSGDSWDETLFSPAQLSFANAFGFPAYTAGADWTLDSTIPGAEHIQAQAAPAELSNNAEFGGQKSTAAIFFSKDSCHAEVITALCSVRYEHPYPPIKKGTPAVSGSPLCALHHQAIVFIQSLLDSDTAVIVPPSGDCDTVYGAQ